MNFIWGLLHEIGHILTLGIHDGDDEKREVIAWEEARKLINSDFPELISKLDSFEKRAIFALDNHNKNSKIKWVNDYSWETNENGERYLNMLEASVE